MIETVLRIFGGIVVFELFIAWIKAVSDEGMLMEEYKYCRGCSCGFCTAEPKQEGCRKWEAEKNGGVH